MICRRVCLAFAVALSLAVPAAVAGSPPERERQAILAMAGDYKVRFDMRETVSFRPDYKPIPAKLSGGYEAVRVIEDTGDVIRLQHLLVVDDDGKPMVIKHWRQDWTYEPATVLTYDRTSRWTLKAVPEAERKGAWSQTVWQTDDSPRYGGVGRWSFVGGVASWQSERTLRPLARRDATRKPVYAWYSGWNRHSLTPTGWVHEQDNAKLGVKDGKDVTYVHETVLNTYDRSGAFPVKAADDYWAKTRAYWADVRKAWDEAIAKDGGVTVTEEADNGSVVGERLMELADGIADEGKDSAAATRQARALIGSPERSQPLGGR